MSRNSFERFYYEKVALGEGCGCAEQIIGTRDLDRRSQEAGLRQASQDGLGDHRHWLRRISQWRTKRNAS